MSHHLLIAASCTRFLHDLITKESHAFGMIESEPPGPSFAGHLGHRKNGQAILFPGCQVHERFLLCSLLLSVFAHPISEQSSSRIPFISKLFQLYVLGPWRGQASPLHYKEESATTSRRRSHSSCSHSSCSHSTRSH